MRSTKNSRLRKLYWEDQDRRTIEKFLWLPQTLKKETRWLKKVSINQELIRIHRRNKHSRYVWVDESWAD